MSSRRKQNSGERSPNQIVGVPLVSKVDRQTPEGREAQTVVLECVKCCVSYTSQVFAKQG